MATKSDIKTDTHQETDTLTIVEETCNLIVWNDDVNTFEWVIECLVKYCNHDSLQAEQCATIVHYNGKCAVKTGAFDKLKPICETLLEKGLNAEIN